MQAFNGVDGGLMQFNIPQPRNNHFPPLLIFNPHFEAMKAQQASFIAKHLATCRKLRKKKKK